MRLFLFLFVLALTIAPSFAQTTVYRDRYGIPSIQAARMSEAAYGLGYAMAQDCAVQMARNYKQARGRMAEVDGRGALLTDGFLRGIGFEELAEAKAKILNGEVAEICDGFLAGANRSLAEQKGKLPQWIEPFTRVDVLALAQFINAAFALLDISHELLPGAGSNQFAVAPKRSATGHAILSMDPHLDWSGLLSWYEFSLYTSDVRFHGVTIIGAPLPAIGHTDKVAWSMTVNSPDQYDFYTVQTNPDNPKQYNFHGEWRDFQDETVELRYRDGNEMKSQRQRIRRTAWGPMVPLRPQAVRLTMVGDWGELEESLAMARAQDANQFRDALRPLGISLYNIVYADTGGNIGYQYNARVPHKDDSIDWTKPVSGADPKTKWGAWWTLDELPHTMNPVSGLLVNCNSGPYLTPLGPEIPAKGWPKYVTSYDMTTRFHRLSLLVDRDFHITPDSAKKYATDTLVPYGSAVARRLGRLVMLRSKAAGQPPGALFKLFTEMAKRGVRSDINSRGTALYVHWLRADPHMVEAATRALPNAGWTPQDNEVALKALDKAVEQMKAEGLPLEVPWGEVHLSHRGSESAPRSGFGYVVPYETPRDDNPVAVAPNWGKFKDGRIEVTGGSSFRMVVDLDPKGVHSWAILPYGESQDPANPHFADQMAMHGRGEYRDTNFGLEQSRQAAVTTVKLEIGR